MEASNSSLHTERASSDADQFPAVETPIEKSDTVDLNRIDGFVITIAFLSSDIITCALDQTAPLWPKSVCVVPRQASCGNHGRCERKAQWGSLRASIRITTAGGRR